MMLVAEAHGKILAEAQNNEDYLTSAVFGDLRYINPGVFWQSFFERTRSSTVDESPLTAAIRHPISDYTRLQVIFWPISPQYGEPWAGGIVRTIGWASFLHDPSQTPHLKLYSIDEAFGIAESTGAANGESQVKELGLGPVVHRFDEHVGQGLYR